MRYGCTAIIVGNIERKFNKTESYDMASHSKYILLMMTTYDTFVHCSVEIFC